MQGAGGPLWRNGFLPGGIGGERGKGVPLSSCSDARVTVNPLLFHLLRFIIAISTSSRDHCQQSFSATAVITALFNLSPDASSAGESLNKVANDLETSASRAD